MNILKAEAEQLNAYFKI